MSALSKDQLIVVPWALERGENGLQLVIGLFYIGKMIVQKLVFVKGVCCSFLP